MAAYRQRAGLWNAVSKYPGAIELECYRPPHITAKVHHHCQGWNYLPTRRSIRQECLEASKPLHEINLGYITHSTNYREAHWQQIARKDGALWAIVFVDPGCLGCSQQRGVHDLVGLEAW